MFPFYKPLDNDMLKGAKEAAKFGIETYCVCVGIKGGKGHKRAMYKASICMYLNMIWNTTSWDIGTITPDDLFTHVYGSLASIFAKEALQCYNENPIWGRTGYPDNGYISDIILSFV
jgi:hypothetical protein